MATTPTGNMGDREILSDLLSSQKHISTNYNTYAGECKSLALRDTFLNILKEEHDIQSDIFTASNERGWYPVKDAPQADIDAAKNKFC